MQKRILVLGGTGAMGVYLIPKLRERGFCVTCVSFDDVKSGDPDLTYIKADAKDPGFREKLLAPGWDGIVDFMIYRTPEFREVYKSFLEKTNHYIYLSTYRVYANEEHPIRETSPRLLDVSKDEVFMNATGDLEDYALYKARGEEILKASGYDNWTAIRPAITYSKRRFQLCTLEAPLVVGRAMTGRKVVLPEAALDVEATMSWAGDVAEMIARLLFNKPALREVFTVATSEHNKWGEVAKIYNELIGLEYVATDIEKYLEVWTGRKDSLNARWQLVYDRLFDRVIDNSKILEYTGLKQSELTSLHDGLKRELSALPKGYNWGENSANARMDAYIASLK